MLTVPNINNDIFLKSSSVRMVPMVTAEWNQNIFNSPYITLAGGAVKENIKLSTNSSKAPSLVTDSNKHVVFDTLKFMMTGTGDSVQYEPTSSLNSSSHAYKIITYVKTDSDNQVMVNTQAKGGIRQFGSQNVEVNSFDWTQVITYIGSEDVVSTLTFKITASLFSADSTYPNIYYTKPEVYPVTKFDYQYGTVWSTDPVFSSFRPGESYVTTGNTNFPVPSDFRKINQSALLNGYASALTMPVSPITSNQNFLYSASPIPLYKNALLTDISPYKYFVSDSGNANVISGIYASPIMTNKIVVKLNTFLSIPKIKIAVTKADGTVLTSETFTKDNGISDAGVLVVYLNSEAFTKNKWTQMPNITNSGDVSNYINIKSISIIQDGDSDVRSQFSSTNASVNKDKNKLSIVEISPRLEVDLSDFVISLSTNKALDGKETYMPISSVSSDDASIVFSSIPIGTRNAPVSIFSNISNLSANKLTGLLRKNVKFYINYNLFEYFDENTQEDVAFGGGKIIPGGVFYSDTWDQSDIDSVTVQCFDTTRYMQSIAVCDQVSINKSAFDLISGIMTLTGFTDYDPDSLYAACLDESHPIEIDFYYASSKDTTLLDALNKIFLPYQIGAYIDNFGIMKFLSLANILKSAKKTTNFNVDASVVSQGGYSISNKAKPGKVSLRYQSPKLKQSLSIANIKDVGIAAGPSYVFTTSNDVVWQQQNIDAVGLNYLSSTMNVDDNFFNISTSDLLDPFHSFNLNNNGYAVIEDEIVSFVYKEYTIQKKTDENTSVTVSVKNDIQLSAQVNKFIQDKQIGLVPNVGVISSASPGSQVTIAGKQYNTTTYGFSSTPTTDVPSPFTGIKVNDMVQISGMSPESLNINAQVVSVGSSSFTVVSKATDSMTSGWHSGRFTTGFDYDIVISPTGRITNVQRGLFGTNVADHDLITDLASKDLAVLNVDSNNSVSYNSTHYSIPSSDEDIAKYGKSLVITPSTTEQIVVYPATATDNDYNTYSMKFKFDTSYNSAAGLMFNAPTTASVEGAYFLELSQLNQGTDAVPDLRYYIALYTTVGNAVTLLAYANITGTVLSIENNFEKVWASKDAGSRTSATDIYKIFDDPREMFHLRFVKYPYKNSLDGEGEPVQITVPESPVDGFVFSVFLNNFEINGWIVYTDANGWTDGAKNTLTNNRKKPVLSTNSALSFNGTRFGAYISATPINLTNFDSDAIGLKTSTFDGSVPIGRIREIYGSQKILKERSVNYYFQDREFLNGLVQGQKLFTLYKEYLMQSEPTIIGINTYDVQYTNPAAVVVDINPVEYSWFYYPGGTLLDQAYKLHQNVDEYSVSYSTPINTGFRAKFALVNNSSHMVYLKKDSDELNQFVVNLNLWTHEIITQSDPEIIEYVTDTGNMNEIIQIDSPWIQSKESASRLLRLVGFGLDPFSKSVSLNIFGNPLMEIGDIITLTYPLMGINQQKYLIHSVSNSYSVGLATKVVLIKLDNGISQ